MTVKNTISDLIDRLRSEIRNGELSFGSLLPTEKELAEKVKVSRPTIAKVYNSLQSEGLIKKKAGVGTIVVFNKDKKQFKFGLLLPGSGESEIFQLINDQFLELEKEKDIDFLWDGTVANNADMRQRVILKNCQSYIEKEVNGILFSPLERTQNANVLNEKICKLFDQNKIPLVLIDRDIYPFPKRSKYDIIGIDNFQGGYIMTECLIRAGCTKIFMFYRKDSAYSVKLRSAGCRIACYDAGIEFNDSNEFCGDPLDSNLVRKISIHPKKTGILCANDSTAAVLVSTLLKLGVKVPYDVLIAGFDDMKYGKLLQVPLSTYRQPTSDIARASIEMMINRLSNPNKTASTISLQGKIIERDSTKFI